MSATAVSVETSAASSTKLAPHAVTHHSAAVVQNNITAAIQNTPGSRPCSSASGGGGAWKASRRLPVHASAGSASDSSNAIRHPACSAAVNDSAPISAT